VINDFKYAVQREEQDHGHVVPVVGVLLAGGKLELVARGVKVDGKLKTKLNK
jgi:hypothetical protein